jgi:hypothetical protein
MVFLLPSVLFDQKIDIDMWLVEDVIYSPHYHQYEH